MPSKSDIGTLREMFDRSKCHVTGRVMLAGSKKYRDSDSRHHWYSAPFGVDFQDGDGVDLVHDLQNPLPASVGLFDHIDCCSVLEHVERPWLAAHNLEEALKPGGTLLLSVPFVWRVHGYPSDYWRFTAEAVRVIFPRIKWRELEYTAYNRIVPRAPSHNIDDRRLFERTEVIGWGIRA